jgi:hypothetical protein
MASITLSGTTFYPSDIAVETEKQGVSLVAASGSRRWAQRVTGGGTSILKSKWVLTWEKATGAVRTAVAAVYVLNSTFTFTDEHGLSYTVQCEGGGDGFKTNISLISSGLVLYYDVELSIYQV